MKVAIDLRALQVGHENRGIGNYLLNILAYFPSETTQYIVVRYDSSDPVKDYSLSLGEKPYQEVVLKRYKFSKNPKSALLFAKGMFSPVFGKVRRLKPDIYFQPDYLFGLPRGFGIKKIVVMYDLIPFLYRNLYLPPWRKFTHLKQLRLRSRILQSVRALYYERRYKRGLKTARRATKVISISKTTTEDLIKIAKVKPKKINTIYLAPSFVPLKNAVQDSKVRTLVKTLSKKYLVFIGGTDPRRQVHELVFAFNLLNAEGHDVSLIFAGNEFVVDSKELSATTKKAIEQSSYKHKIHMLGRISETDKQHVLENGLAFVYPTLYEGFGLPILEAMASGCPVITYSNSATKEIAQDAALYTKAPSGESIYSSVLELLENSDLRSKLVQEGYKRSNDFSWEKTGEETVATIFTK